PRSHKRLFRDFHSARSGRYHSVSLRREGILQGTRECRVGACFSVNTFELTKQLMSIPSVSGTEGKVGEFLVSHLGSLGYRVERQTVPPARSTVTAFAGGTPGFLRAPPTNRYPPVLPIREDDAYLYGRGACDTKGIIAAMLEAGARLRRDGRTNFGY